MTKKKIAFIAQPFDGVLPPNQNSIGLIIYNSARCLARDAEVTVYLQQRGDSPQVEVQDGITYRHISTRLDEAMVAFMGRYPRFFDTAKLFASSYYYLSYILQISLDLRKRDIDVVHIVNFSQFAPVVKRFNPGCKVALEMQCEWLEQLNRRVCDKRLAKVDLVTGSSNHIADGVRKVFPHLDIPVQTAYNGFDEQRFAPGQIDSKSDADSAATLIFVGRVSPEKGVHLLIEAMGRLVGEFPGTKLLIVGPRTQLPLEYIVGISDDEGIKSLAVFYDGTLSRNYQQYLDRRIGELNLGDNVSFTGPLAQSELVDLYRSATVLVNPSYSESFGMSLVEAMGVGLPVVATKVGGMKEIVVSGETGYLVGQGDDQELTRCLRELLKDSNLSKEMGGKGRLRALECFSWDRRAADLIRYYDAIQ